MLGTINWFSFREKQRCEGELAHASCKEQSGAALFIPDPTQGFRAHSPQTPRLKLRTEGPQWFQYANQAKEDLVEYRRDSTANSL